MSASSYLPVRRPRAPERADFAGTDVHLWGARRIPQGQIRRGHQKAWSFGSYLIATVTDAITAIYFEDGQRVRYGDILAVMTSAEEHALLEEERSTMDEAQEHYERVQLLVARGAVARSELDQRKREYDTARARYRANESRLQDRLILAPFPGVVGLRNISVGALIEPEDLITTLDDDSVMKLDLTVPAIHLATLKTGLLMSVRLLKNPREAVVIPEETLIPSGQANHVLVVDRSPGPQVAKRREVKIGARRPGDVEIVNGPKPGEFVTTHGTLRARPDQAMKIIAADTGDESLEQLLEQGVGGPVK
jgi:membrane fusion protein (multidrug efflux system)